MRATARPWRWGSCSIGVPYALLWGVIAAVLRYVPYIGPWIAAVFPVALSMLMADGWQPVVWTLALVGVLELVSNLWVEPMLYGRGIGVSETATLIMVAFWTWLWGPVGLVLATPLTVCVVVLGRNVPQLRFFDTLLGDRQVLSPDVRFYQRLLARDTHEAAHVAQAHAGSMGCWPAATRWCCRPSPTEGATACAACSPRTTSAGRSRRRGMWRCCSPRKCRRS